MIAAAGLEERSASIACQRKGSRSQKAWKKVRKSGNRFT
jgi:hypothetical protein